MFRKIANENIEKHCIGTIPLNKSDNKHDEIAYDDDLFEEDPVVEEIHNSMRSKEEQLLRKDEQLDLFEEIVWLGYWHDFNDIEEVKKLLTEEDVIKILNFIRIYFSIQT